ncbi:MAG: hypothetical protein C4560_09560 [Nitrospiraceae bacterium]|nr:MAG: hypothetical protein C4560_09560 [Nitrospiraceae bacterium]
MVRKHIARFLCDKLRNALGILLLSAAIVPSPADAKKALTIDELAMMYDIKTCAGCHEEKYEEWKTSSMGNSVTDPRVLRAMRTFIRLAIDREEALERKDLTICLDCHVPQIKDASPELILHIGDLVLTSVEERNAAKREAAIKELSKLNINCRVCHNLKSTGYYVKPREDVIYGPRSIDYSPHEGIGFSTVRSDFMKTSEFCAQCHHCPPAVLWKECPTIYTSYIDDFVSKGHTDTCQDCHMKGQELSHRFLGPSDPDFLSSAVSMTVNARATRYIDIYENNKMPAVVVIVELASHAGHEIPHG